MLEALTPGATIVISACSCLLCLGLVWSLQVYFLPYLTQRRLNGSSTPRQDMEIAIDEELCHSLYAFPGLLHHCPRGSLTECELQSIKWSTTCFQSSPLEHPPEINVHRVRKIETQTKITTKVPSFTYSDLRQSLISYSTLPIPTENSCSTITTVGHANNSAPPPVKRYRKSMHSFSESSSSTLKTPTRRHSAPILSVYGSQLPSSASVNDPLADQHFQPIRTTAYPSTEKLEDYMNSIKVEESTELILKQQSVQTKLELRYLAKKDI